MIRLLRFLIALLFVTALFLPLERASIGPPMLLYRRAQEADLATAQALYARLSLDLPQVAEYLLLASAKAALPQMEAVQELESIIASFPRSPAAFEAHLALARHYASLGDEKAEAHYRAALELEESVALRLELARYLEARERKEEAYEEYKALLPQHPAAFQDMRRLAYDPLRLAADLNAHLYYHDTVEVLRSVTDPAALPLRARALYSLGRYQEAKEAYESWMALYPNDADGHFGLGRVLSALGFWEEAFNEYAKANTPDALVAQAQILEASEPEGALEIYDDLASPYGWWRATTLLEAQGREGEALPFYARLARSQAALADDAAYRMYVMAQRLGDLEAQEEALTLLEDLSPNYLALLARGQDFAPPLAPPYPPAGEDILGKAEALELLGLDHMAQRELLFAARFSEDPALHLAMAQALMERGYLSEAQRMAVQTLAQEETVPLTVWALAYPQPYREEVDKAAQEFDLDPLLIYAVMREESRYDPEALSSSYAQGLIQVIPSTAQWIGEKLGVEVEPAEIFQPVLNLRLGAWYLRFVLDYFEGDLEYAVAAYNGGPGNVQAWREDPRVKDKADFLRWMGLAETREYVSKVLLTYRVYQWLETSPKAP